MKLTHYLTITLVITVLCSAAWSQTTTRPTTTESFGTLPELKFDNIKLDDALTFLSDVDPTFAPQLVRAPGVPADYPTITFHAKNITVPQFLEFLQKAYGIDSTKIDGPGGPVYLITVEYSVRVQKQIEAGFRAEAGSEVHVHNISDIVERVREMKTGAAGDENPALTKEALNDVLSLVQAALDQTHQANKAMLKVHEATQTLLFKGTAEQEILVSETLKTLQPTGDQMRANILAVQRLEQQLAELRRQLEQTRLSQAELTRLRRLLQGADAPTTRP